MSILTKMTVRRMMKTGMVFILMVAMLTGTFGAGKNATEGIITAKAAVVEKTALEEHGKLSVKGTKLVDENGEPFQLKGISSHGINWDVGEPFVNKKALKAIRNKWGSNCFRVAMYTQDYNGYCVTDEASQKKLLGTIDKAVKAAKSLGMYVIIDWHILNDQTPVKYQAQSQKFFEKMAKTYGTYDNVLFEICNEPNGGTSWAEIKKYAETIIKTIRKYSDNIIIVGTPTWSQDVDAASASPIKNQKNIMYTVHFYAATHKDSYREKVKVAVANGLPVICTEFSACEASGNGNYDFDSAKKWLELLDSYDISYVCWSLSNKNETASLLKASCTRTGGFRKTDLSEMGKWIKKWYKNN